MVLDAADSNHGATESIAHLTQMGVQLFSQCEILERGLAVLCGEHQIHTDCREGLRHG